MDYYDHLKELDAKMQKVIEIEMNEGTSIESIDNFMELIKKNYDIVRKDKPLSIIDLFFMNSIYHKVTLSTLLILGSIVKSVKEGSFDSINSKDVLLTTKIIHNSIIAAYNVIKIKSEERSLNKSTKNESKN